MIMNKVEEIMNKVEDNSEPCPCCGHVPDTHRKMQVRHLHVKCGGMIRFITDLQNMLGVVGGFKKMLEAVKTLKES